MSAQRQIHDPHQRERGQALALFALALTVVIAAAGLVLDGGMAFMNRREAQNAADLGAMAGTAVIAEYYAADGSKHSRNVWDAIDASVQANGCTSGGAVPCTWTAAFLQPAASGPGAEYVIDPGLHGAIPDSGRPIPAGTQGVEVTVQRQPPTALLSVVGITEWDVNASAQAITAQIGSVPSGILLPIAVDPREPPNTFQPGGTYILSLGQDAPGQFSWLTWNGDHNASALASHLCTLQNPAIDLTDADTSDDWIEGDNGKTNSSDVRDCLSQWIGELILLPTYDLTQDSGSNATFHITGFTFWRLSDFDADPFIDNLKATFIGYGPARVGQNYNGPPCNAAVDAACQQYSFFLGLIS